LPQHPRRGAKLTSEERRSRIDDLLHHVQQHKEFAMNWDRIEGNWKQFSGKVKEKWGKLTEDDLQVINGRRDQAKKELDDWSNSL
jgi:uncharacterized protein YjbJ (UPF0337 family)